MKQFIVDRHTTPNTPTLEQVPTDKIPLYPTEQDLLDDLANLEVGQIAGTIDPAESELIGVLIQKIQALENGEKYSTEEVKTNMIWFDGKPIYRKTYPFTTSLTSIDGTSLNIDTLIKIEGGGYSTGSSQTENEWFPLGFTSNSGDVYVSMKYDKSTKLFTYIGWRNLINGYYTLLYTKTTD